MASSSHQLGDDNSKMWEDLQKNKLGYMEMQSREETGQSIQFVPCAGFALARFISGLSGRGAKSEPGIKLRTFQVSWTGTNPSWAAKVVVLLKGYSNFRDDTRSYTPVSPQSLGNHRIIEWVGFERTLQII